MARFWCGVVSLEHIKRGVAGGFCQVCHGKRAPLERMAVGDGIVFYSPALEFKGKEKYQKFSAIGQVTGEKVYHFQMTDTFIPYRRDINYLSCKQVSIHFLLPHLELTSGKHNWGYKFRFGHFEISRNDFSLVAREMVPDQELSSVFNLEGTKFSNIPPDSGKN